MNRLWGPDSLDPQFDVVDKNDLDQLDPQFDVI